jgi:hypothetical protein
MRLVVVDRHHHHHHPDYLVDLGLGLVGVQPGRVCAHCPI